MIVYKLKEIRPEYRAERRNTCPKLSFKRNIKTKRSNSIITPKKINFFNRYDMY